MPQSFACAYVHIIFGTKNRESVLTKELITEFARYIHPILEDHKSRAIAAGGMPDHVHLLIDLGRDTPVATIVREVKAKTSAWLTKKLGKRFNWQLGYGAFSVSVGHVPNVVRYIANQEEHHREKTFQEEFEEILKAAGVKFDPAHLWQEEAA